MIDHGYEKLQHSHDLAKKTVVVNWCLTDMCNYSCSYCLPGLHKGKIGLPDYDVVLKFCKKVIESYSPKKICFEFTGGEVTIWKEFPNLIKALKEYPNVAVGMISNASRDMEFWKYMTELSIDQACLSFQPEMADPIHYLEVVKLLSGHMRTHVNIMMHPEYFDECLKMADSIVNNCKNVSMALQPLLVDFTDQLFDYTEKQLEIIDAQHELFGARVKWDMSRPIHRGAMEMIYNSGKTVLSSAHRFIGDKTNRWKGWRCYAGVEQIVVDLDGTVWRGWCKEGGSLGNIKNEVKLNPSPIICKRDFCHCNIDIMCTKEKI